MGNGYSGPAGAVYDRLCGLDVVVWFTLWNEVEAKAGGLGNIASRSRHVGGIAPAPEEVERSTESEDSQSPLSK